MTALAADTFRDKRQGVLTGFPIAASQVIYGNAFVAVNAAGYAVPGADTAGLIFIGVHDGNHQDNSGGANGAKMAVVRRRGEFLVTIGSTVTQANVGDQVFLVDDDTVDLGANVDNAIYCGVITEVVSSTLVWIDIEPAVKQADVATHIADTSGAHAASAISITDAGAHFAAAEHTVELALQKLAKTIVVTIPLFTGWTKDGDPKAIVNPALELPVAVKVKRAYVKLGTAPGADKTLILALNTSTLVEISGTDVVGEAENLDIAVAANTDFAVTAAETAGGNGANVNIMLICQVDDGE